MSQLVTSNVGSPWWLWSQTTPKKAVILSETDCETYDLGVRPFMDTIGTTTLKLLTVSIMREYQTVHPWDYG